MMLSREAGLTAQSRRAPTAAAASPVVLRPVTVQQAGTCSPAPSQLGPQQPARSIRAHASTTEAVSGVTPNMQSGDVYVNDPKPLKEGEEKHVISIFVADEAGLINRVAGVFARRGANIESLAVGLSGDKALFTVVVTGTTRTVANLVKQLSKLVKVRYVEDITRTNRIEREMILLKLNATAGAARTEVLQIATVFRARVVDMSDNTATIVATGDPGKLAALQKVLAKFGIVELTRTGRVSLKRGEQLLSQGTGGPEGPEEEAAPEKPAQSYSRPAGSGQADVYAVESSLDLAEWDDDNRLTYSPTGTRRHDSEEAAHTLNIEVQDVPGVLNQVTGVFARRGYNVKSLAVGPSERDGNSRIVMVVPGRPGGIGNLLRQLYKLVYVQQLTDLTDVPFVQRELMLVKVRCTAPQRGELRDLVAIFRSSIVDVSPTTVTIEVVGKEDKLKALTDMLEPYGVVEMARTGCVAMVRDSGVNTPFLEKMSIGRVW